MEFKYVIDSHDNFAIFSRTQVHAHMDQAMDGKIVGAGFCIFTIGYKMPTEYLPGEDNTKVCVRCYGESISLGIKSRPEDQTIINNSINRD